MELRRIGTSDIRVTPIAMGCWPIAGMTSLGVTDEDSLATLEAAVDAGVNFFDTAYCYGANGESEDRIARALGPVRDKIVLATKGGIHWGPDGKQVRDASPVTLKRECAESLRRLRTDRVELLYLHAPDPSIPIEESAAALAQLQREGKALTIGLSNASVEQLTRFHAVCPLSAYQPHYNMLQREIEDNQLPWCVANHVSVMVYWPLLKGLLAGKLPRDHVFDPRDGRAKYAMFHGEEWRKNHDFVDELRVVADQAKRTFRNSFLTGRSAGPASPSPSLRAKRPDQIRESAAAMNFQLTDAEIEAIDAAIAKRGPSISRRRFMNAPRPRRQAT
ncbi:MAG: aldo/keto reductase [Planctomycetota bacterium]